MECQVPEGYVYRLEGMTYGTQESKPNMLIWFKYEHIYGPGLEPMATLEVLLVQQALAANAGYRPATDADVESFEEKMLSRHAVGGRKVTNYRIVDLMVPMHLGGIKKTVSEHTDDQEIPIFTYSPTIMQTMEALDPIKHADAHMQEYNAIFPNGVHYRYADLVYNGEEDGETRLLFCWARGTCTRMGNISLCSTLTW